MFRKRWIGWFVAGVVVVAIVSVTWGSRDQLTYARIATGYAAKQTCSCLHVGGRSLESCLSDYPAEARRDIVVSVDGDMVSASVLFGAIKSEAVFEEEYGCRILE